MPKANKTGDFTLTFRVNEDLLKWIDAHAQSGVRSRAQEIEYLIRLGVAEVERGGNTEVPSGKFLDDLVARLAEKLGK